MKVECPSCGSGDTTLIVYGYPMLEDIERVEAGEIILGGCVISADSPTHHCIACGERFGRLADDGEGLQGAAFVTFEQGPT